MPAPTFARCVRLAIVSSFLSAATVAAQQPAGAPRGSTGWETVGLPALNFDADEGFGYGVLLEMYDYGTGQRPYRLTIQPTLFLTTKGRRDVTLFVDAPALLPGGWRGSMFLGREQQLATPYYGAGNASSHEEALEGDANPYFYRFGRTRLRATADLQHRLGALPARFLIGAGVSRVAIDLTPFDQGTTLLAGELNGETPAPSRENYVRAGLVWDTRDREIGATRGTWADLLVQRTTSALGATSDYTRLTATVRRYVPIGNRLVLAQRVLAQNVVGNVPFHELATVQTSFKQQEGLGGANTIRGLPKNRFVGKGTLLSNTELRWHATDFAILGKPSSLVLSSFADAGRVWASGFDVGTGLRGLHVGYGLGSRVGLGESFVVALDVGHSKESTAPLYIGLGYMF